MRQILLAAAALALTASAAQASGAPKKEGAAAPSSQYVDITPVALPIVDGGRLMNYVFVQVRVNLAPSADAQKMREKEPFLRDALVRVSHRTPFTGKTDYMHIDEPALKAAVAREVGPLLGGARNIASIQIMSQQAKQRVGPMRPAA